MAEIQRSGKTFEGVVCSVTQPMWIPVHHVRRVHMFDIPAVLRERANYSLNGLAGNEWWTVGEFRYAGEGYDMAIARRVTRGGRTVVEYGVEV